MPMNPSVRRVAARWLAKNADGETGEIDGGWEPGHLREDGLWEPGQAVPRGVDPLTYTEQGSQVPPERTSYGEELDDGEVVPNVKRVAARFLTARG